MKKTAVFSETTLWPWVTPPCLHRMRNRHHAVSVLSICFCRPAPYVAARSTQGRRIHSRSKQNLLLGDMKLLKSLSTFNSRVLLLCLSTLLELRILCFTSCSVCRVPVDFQVGPASTCNCISRLKPHVAARSVVPVQASWTSIAAQKIFFSALYHYCSYRSGPEYTQPSCDHRQLMRSRQPVSIVAHNKMVHSMMCL